MTRGHTVEIPWAFADRIAASLDSKRHKAGGSGCSTLWGVKNTEAAQRWCCLAFLRRIRRSQLRSIQGRDDAEKTHIFVESVDTRAVSRLLGRYLKIPLEEGDVLRIVSPRMPKAPVLREDLYGKASIGKSLASATGQCHRDKKHATVVGHSKLE